ncbi:hypothetical protein [Microbacterium panaciterrae]|uniref:Uncharacterized protein n=1 Tax=Microbacterium panaciterrae TaxID=985759 RepID=A0ABP8PTX8_9MICO
MTRMVDACAGLARSLARLFWWISVTVIIVWAVAGAILDGDPSDLGSLLTALRPG